jgi:hypothetical protein
MIAGSESNRFLKRDSVIRWDKSRGWMAHLQTRVISVDNELRQSWEASNATDCPLHNLRSIIRWFAHRRTSTYEIQVWILEAVLVMDICLLNHWKFLQP